MLHLLVHNICCNKDYDVYNIWNLSFAFHWSMKTDQYHVNWICHVRISITKIIFQLFSTDSSWVVWLKATFSARAVNWHSGKPLVRKMRIQTEFVPLFQNCIFGSCFSVSIYQEYLFLESRNFVNIREFFTTLVYLIINHTTLPILFETYKSIVALELPLLTSKLKNTFQFVSDQWEKEE